MTVACQKMHNAVNALIWHLEFFEFLEERSYQKSAQIPLRLFHRLYQARERFAEPAPVKQYVFIVIDVVDAAKKGDEKRLRLRISSGE